MSETKEADAIEAARSEPISKIEGWHAHVYFDESTKETALALRADIEAEFGSKIEMGRFHERLVGPHPRNSYQVAFNPAVFAEIIPWLGLNRRGLTVFTHPESGDVVADHEVHALWMGEMLELNMDALRRFAAKSASVE